MSDNKVYFTVINNQLNKQFEFNYWAYDSTTVNDAEYKYANEFAIVKVNTIKYICFVPFNIDADAKVRAAVNVSTSQDINSTIKMKYLETEIEMEEGFIYRCNDENKFDKIAIPEGVSYRSSRRSSAKMSFAIGGHKIFDESIYSTFANGDRLILNEFYWAFDEKRKLALYQKFILRETETEYRYILLKRFSPVGSKKNLGIECSIGDLSRTVHPSNVIFGYPMKNNQFGIRYNRLGFVQTDDNQFSEYVMETLKMETIDVSGSIHLN